MYTNLHLHPDAQVPQVARRSSATCSASTTRTATPRSTTRWCAWRRTSSLRVPLVDGARQLRLARRRRAGRLPLHRGRLAPLGDGAARASSSSETVDFRPNYDGTTEEPIVLPARVPATCSSTARPASRSAWRPTSRRTTCARSCEALIALIDDRELETSRTCSSTSRARTSRPAARCSTARTSCARSTRPGRARSALRGEYKLEERQARRRRHRHHLDPVRADQGDARRADRRGDHRRASCRMLVDVRDESTDDVRIVLEIKKDADPDAGDGVPLQAHAARRRTSTST